MCAPHLRAAVGGGWERALRQEPAPPGTTPVPLGNEDLAAIFRGLARHGVEYVLIGGVAAELHGVALARSGDADICVARARSGRSNLRRLADFLVSVRAQRRVIGVPPEDLPPMTAADHLAYFAAVQSAVYVTTAGPFDIAFNPDGSDGYTDLAQRAVVIDFEGVPVRLAALRDIYRSKWTANREKDIAVLPLIKRRLEEIGDWRDLPEPRPGSTML